MTPPPATWIDSHSPTRAALSIAVGVQASAAIPLMRYPNNPRRDDLLTEPHRMNWNEGLDEGVKLALAAAVGALWQRISLGQKLTKLELLEKDVADLKVEIKSAATKTDLAHATNTLESVLRAELNGIMRLLEQKL